MSENEKKIESLIYDAYYPSESKKVTKRTDIDFSIYPEEKLNTCFMFKKIDTTMEAVAASVRGNLDMILFLSEARAVNENKEKSGNYNFDNFDFRYTFYINTHHIFSKNAFLKKIQLKVSNDGFFYKILSNLNTTTTTISRYQGKQEMNSQMSSDFLISLKQHFNFLFYDWFDSATIVGYYDSDNLRIEVIVKKECALNGVLLPSHLKLNKMIVEFSVTFEHGYPVLDHTEYEDHGNYSNVHHFRNISNENSKLSGMW